MRTPISLCLLTVSLLTLPVVSSQALVISGSDLLAKPVQEAIESGLTAAGIEADVTFDGSLLGMRDLEEGSVDASLLAIPDAASGSTELRRYPIGFQIVALAAHESNPVAELTYEQLANLYKDNGTLEDWSDLVSDPAWSDRKISLMAARRENTITLELFNALVMKGERFKPSVRYLTGNDSSLQAAVVEDPTALVLVPSIKTASPVKLLAVKETATDQGYTPSRDNVFFGDYPLRLPFYLVVSGDLDEETVGDLVKVLYSPEVTAALEAANCIPVPEPEKRSVLTHFE